MSGILNTLESKLGGMMGGNSNNNGNNNNQQNNDPNNQSGNMGGNQGGNQGGNMGGQTTDRYESTIQQGEGYVKSHYQNDANVMRGEQMVEQADNYRLGRNNMGNMQGGVGGTMSSDVQPNPQAGNMGNMGGDFSKQGNMTGTDTTFNKENSNYGADGGMGPATGMQQGGMNQQNM